MTGSLTGVLLLSILVQLGAALSALFFHSRQRFIVSVIFPVSGAASALALAAGFAAVASGVIEKMVIPIGLPGLPFHLRIDPLSGFFVTAISLLSVCVSVYSIGYVRGFIRERTVTHLAVFYPVFIAGMTLVLVSDDAFFFLLSWELMAAASYFLVLYEDGKRDNRRAAFLYILMAHVGAVAILLSFGVAAGFAGGGEPFQEYTFDSMRGAKLPALWASVAFVLALFGFGAKMGIIPLHVWLPEAHPAAPSNVSALMSGAMLKTAVYGIIRFSFDILQISQLWWGELVLIIGLITAIMGVLYAMMENDLKRLLAYSSVENVGIIFIGVGLSMIFVSFNKPVMAALAITAALYHTLNHTMFKGLLFMGAGAVLHSTHERNMDSMGGLIHRMRFTAPLFLVGCASISALPPFNGFVSEWLTFQAFLMSPALPNHHLNLLIPLGAALLALTGVLAASTFVKAFGVSFLGHSRSAHCSAAHEASLSMVAGMTLAALFCLILGVIPTVVIGWMSPISTMLTRETIAHSAGGLGWMWLTPVAAARASYSGPMVFVGIISVVVIVFLTLHARKSTFHRGPLWDCGFRKITPSMQYSSTAFSMPQRTIFGYLFRIKESVKPEYHRRAPQFPVRVKYSLKVRDRLWGWLYRPISDTAFRLSRFTARLQHGRIHIYLSYSFFTIILLLLFVL